MTTTAVYSLGHGLQTLLQCLGRPAFHHSGNGKMSIGFRLSNNNNKWQLWMWTVAAERQTHRPRRLVWPQHSVCIHQINRVNSHNGFGHDDSTINIVIGIIRPHCSTTYYRQSSVISQSVMVVSLQTPLNQLTLDGELRWAQGTMYQMGSRSPT